MLFGWGERNREGRELVELVMRNGLALAGTFFKKREKHTIAYSKEATDVEREGLQDHCW